MATPAEEPDNKRKKEKSKMDKMTGTTENKIQELFNEIDLYKQAIQDAKDALASAEQELDETLDAEYGDR